jgi:hypothetical protein
MFENECFVQKNDLITNKIVGRIHRNKMWPVQKWSYCLRDRDKSWLRRNIALSKKNIEKESTWKLTENSKWIKQIKPLMIILLAFL